MTTDDPDFVFDDAPIREYLWDFLRDNDVEPGDEVRVETETTSWKSRMEVTRVKSGGVEIAFRSTRGTEYRLVISQVHPIGTYKPVVRGPNYESKGVLDRLEVYK